jgi:hypothetical protein
MRRPEGNTGRGIWRALCDIDASDGWREPYRGMGQTVAGNASSQGYCLLGASPSFLRIACFIVKLIWLHVECALIILKSDPAANQNAGVLRGSHSEWPRQPKLRPR